MTATAGPLHRFFQALARLQSGRPWLVVGLVALTLLPAGWAASRLELRTDWTELLPEDRRSIKDLKRIQARMGSSSTLTVVIEGESLADMQRLADDVAARAAELPGELVRWVDKDLRDERAHFESRRWLYASVSELERVRDDLAERIAERKAEAAFDLGLEEEEEPPAEGAAPSTEGFDLGALEERYAERMASYDRYPGGYFAGERGRLLAVFLRTSFGGSQIGKTNDLEARVSRLVEELEPTSYHPSIRVSFTGPVITAREEQEALAEELLVVTILCISLIVGSIYFFYFEARAVLVIGASVLVGVTWTFGITWACIGYLSTATAFLASIVAGNGINSGIILSARILEERRRGLGIEQAIETSLAATWAATLTAAIAASLSYGALVLTDFRGFSQFGFIGGIGITLCWVGNYLVAPVIFVLTERATLGPARQRRGGYGRPALWLSAKAPLATVTLTTLLALGGLALGWTWLRGDPFEYDFRKLRNERSRLSGAGRLQDRVNQMMRSRPREGMVLLADRPEQVPGIVAALAAERESRAKAEGVPPIGDVRSIQDLVPPDQEAKIALLAAIRERALEVLPRLDDEQRARLEPWVPPETLAPMRVEDVPASLTRPFVEKDGTVGLVLYVAPPVGVSVWDGRGLQRFARAVRAVRLPSGEVVHSSGQPVIFADMIDAIVEDGPWLTLASLGAIAALVVVTFRRAVTSALVLFPLLVGMAWMLGLTALTDLGIPGLASYVTPLKLNFLNFIAIPITFGIGVDYAVNMVRRYAEDGWDSTEAVLLETGGAVILCSLTTIWGYLSLLYSDNQALRSFGKLAVLGEITCLVAAVVVLPSLVRLTLARRTR